MAGVFDVVNFPLIFDETIFISGKHGLIGRKRLDLFQVVRRMPIDGDVDVPVFRFFNRKIGPYIVPKLKDFSSHTDLTSFFVGQ